MIKTKSSLVHIKQVQPMQDRLHLAANNLPYMLPVQLRLPPTFMLNSDQFFDLCQENKNLSIERTQGGEMIVIMLPAGGETGNRNSELAGRLWTWAHQNKRGVSFDSSTGFDLPNGATRSPDAAWVRRNRLANLTAEQKKKFLPLCPDFVVELCSPSDQLSMVQDKMKEYIENGALLGWLIDPDEQKVHVYRPHVAPVILDHPTSVSGDPELPGFVLELGEIWQPGF